MPFQIDQRGGVPAAKTCVTEWSEITDGVMHAVARDIAERIDVQMFANFVHRLLSADQLLAGRHVDAIITWRYDWRTRHPEKNFAGAGLPDAGHSELVLA